MQQQDIEQGTNEFVVQSAKHAPSSPITKMAARNQKISPSAPPHNLPTHRSSSSMQNNDNDDANETPIELIQEEGSAVISIDSSSASSTSFRFRELFPASTTRRPNRDEIRLPPSIARSQTSLRSSPARLHGYGLPPRVATMSAVSSRKASKYLREPSCTSGSGTSIETPSTEKHGNHHNHLPTATSDLKILGAVSSLTVPTPSTLKKTRAPSMQTQHEDTTSSSSHEVISFMSDVVKRFDHNENHTVSTAGNRSAIASFVSSLGFPVKMVPHLGDHRQYWRDMILGVNDGLVSTFLLVAAVTGGGADASIVLLTGVSGALSGSISMCAGEWIATKSQNDVLQGELKLEDAHIRTWLEEELKEVPGLLSLIGIDETTCNAVLRNGLLDFYANNPRALFALNKTLEFGVLDDEMRSPGWAAASSGLLFLLGALPSIIPFMVSESPKFALTIAAILTTATLLIVGGVKSWATRGSFLTSALENLVVAGVGGSLAYGVGLLFEFTVLNNKD